MNDLPPEEEYEEPKYKKYILYAAGIVMILLVLSYLVTLTPVGRVIETLLDSTVIQNSTITEGNITIEFLEDTKDIVESFYLQTQDREISLCLEGYINETYYVTNVYQPTTYHASVGNVISAPCSAETVIMLHSQPYMDCLASPQDLITLAKQPKERIMLIMCEIGRFGVYKQ